MATLNGEEVTACERCTDPTGAEEVTVTKPTGDVQRVLCKKCQEATAETYPVKSIGRASAKTSAEDDGPPTRPSPQPHAAERGRR